MRPDFYLQQILVVENVKLFAWHTLSTLGVVNARKLVHATPTQLTVALIVNVGTQKRQGWIGGTGSARYLSTTWTGFADSYEIAPIPRRVYVSGFDDRCVRARKGSGDPAIHHRHYESANQKSCPSFAHRRHPQKVAAGRMCFRAVLRLRIRTPSSVLWREWSSFDSTSIQTSGR